MSQIFTESDERRFGNGIVDTAGVVTNVQFCGHVPCVLWENVSLKSSARVFDAFRRRPIVHSAVQESAGSQSQTWKSVFGGLRLFSCWRPPHSLHLQRTSKSISVVLVQPLTPRGACINTLSFDKARRLPASLSLSLCVHPPPAKSFYFLRDTKAIIAGALRRGVDGKGICHQGEFC